ncbi:MAG: hypothetical protein IPP81_16110 [Chitinophagaceae bacterium]|nr:hypothetical protein [Chitinophagaceae bacterium]
MGTISKGILGGFSGKVGNVVGGNWKGIDYMRSKAARRNFKPTQPQLEQQLKFALAVRFIQTITALVEISFGDFAVRKTGFNSAVSYTLKNAVTGTYPVFNLQFADVLVSRGDLPNVLAPTVTVAAGGLVTWAWTDNSGVGIARPTDKALLVVHCPALNQSIYTTGSAGRSALSDTLNLASFSGQDVHCWIGFISEDGQNVSTSLYNGMFTVS